MGPRCLDIAYLLNRIEVEGDGEEGGEEEGEEDDATNACIFR